MRSFVSTAWDKEKRPRRLYEKVCEVCGRNYYVPRHFINKRKTYSIACRIKRMERPVEVTCARCGAVIVRNPSKLKNSRSGLFFCNRECKELSQAIGGIDLIQPKHYGDGAWAYRGRAFRRYGRRCGRCGYDKDVHMLDVDHIDGDRSNNADDNLQVLCVWCHAMKTRGVTPHAWIGQLA